MQETLLGLLLGLVAAFGIITFHFEKKINQINHKLDKIYECEVSPHAESSIFGVMKNGKFHVTHPATRTGCVSDAKP